MSNGWDNVVFRLGHELLVRLPRREMAARLVEHEQRWLPLLGPRLPLPIPAPVRVGRPDLRYPWPWSVVPFLPGSVAADTAPDDPRNAALRLGEFLAALHLAAAPDAPANPFRGVPLADRTDAVMRNLATVAATVDGDAVRREWDAAVEVPRWDGAPVWLHGDLHPANVLVHHGRISGVIDFGDITAGDPATDLAVAWMLLPARHYPTFRHAYSITGRPVARDDPLWARARGWALALSLAYLAHSADNPQLARIGARTLAAVLAPE